MLKIAVLASGGGTDFQSIIDAVESKQINCKIEMLIASSRRKLGKAVDYGRDNGGILTGKSHIANFVSHNYILL